MATGNQHTWGEATPNPTSGGAQDTKCDEAAAKKATSMENEKSGAHPAREDWPCHVGGSHAGQ